jgi:hypothetical protein
METWRNLVTGKAQKLKSAQAGIFVDRLALAKFPNNLSRIKGRLGKGRRRAAPSVTMTLPRTVAAMSGSQTTSIAERKA